MLYFWAKDRRSFGIPVGSDASRILSEAVFLNIDRRMAESGITFVRYVDDYRIFAKTRLEAHKALEKLTLLLSEEGLTPNSRKTDIYQILSEDELSYIDDVATESEHEAIDLEEKITEIKRTRVSGRSSISRVYREPGKDALKKIQETPKADILNAVNEAEEHAYESKLKLAMKYFLYADQDVAIIQACLERRVTSIFYICDALTKESDKISDDTAKCIVQTVLHGYDWQKAPYPLQIPVLKLAASPKFADSALISHIVDSQLQSDNMLFFREAITLGYHTLDRHRLRSLSVDVFENVPSFVQRAIYSAVKVSNKLSDDESRPLCRNMKQHSDDWFIERM